MVAVPMIPAAPVTTATRPSRRIRSGIAGVSFCLVPVIPDFGGFARVLARVGDYFICGGG